MSNRSSMLFPILIVLAAPLPLAAHHSYSSEYDENKPIMLEGTISRMEWVNPHAVIHVAVNSPDGTVSEYAVESNSPNILIRRGLTKDSMRAGMKVSVGGYQSRDGSNTIAGVTISFKDGRSVFLGSKLVWAWPPKKSSQ